MQGLPKEDQRVDVRLILALRAEEPRQHTKHHHTDQSDNYAPAILPQRYSQHISIHISHRVHKCARYAPEIHQQADHHLGHR